MSNNIVTTAHLQARSKEARDKLIAIFKEITEYSRVNEKEGVIRYITAVPVDVSNETSIYMVEQYKDRAASDAHLIAAPVQKLIKFMTEDGPLSGAPEIFELNPNSDFRRPIADPTPDMLLILAHMGYQNGKTTTALPAFQDLISTCEKMEPQFLGCAVCEDKANNNVRVVDLFESEKFYDEVHAKSEAIGKFHESQTMANGEFSLVKLKIVQGFLGR